MVMKSSMTGSASQVRFEHFNDSQGLFADTLLVFSAPKYCDSTENKGAYINIGPELKLEYHQFEAVPHPDVKPMVSHLHRKPMKERT